MLIGGSKSRTAFMDGYFEKKFDRIMEVRIQSQLIEHTMYFCTMYILHCVQLEAPHS